MRKEFKLSDFIDWVHEYELGDEKDVHPSHKQDVIIVPKVKEFIRLLEKHIQSQYGKSPSKMRILEKLKELAGDLK